MSLSGYPTIFGIDPYSESDVPLHQVGVKGVTSDGRIFRYARNSSAAITGPGLLCKAADVVTAHEDITVAATGAIGDASITLDIGGTAITANQYNNGYLIINDDAGEGFTYLVIQHPASSAGSEEIAFRIKPTLQAVITVDVSDASLVQNPHSNILITSGDVADFPVGVTPIAISASFYFWLQTGGIAAVLSDTTTAPVSGQPITIGDATYGAVEVIGSVTDPIVGQSLIMTYATDDEFNPQFLTLDK